MTYEAPKGAYGKARRATKANRADQTIRVVLGTADNIEGSERRPKWKVPTRASNTRVPNQKRVSGTQWEEERVKVSREDQATSLLEINTEGRHATVLNRGTRSVARLQKCHLFPLLGTYRWMCGLVGADVVKIFVHTGKHRKGRVNVGVHKCTPFCTNCCKY